MAQQRILDKKSPLSMSFVVDGAFLVLCFREALALSHLFSFSPHLSLSHLLSLSLFLSQPFQKAVARVIPYDIGWLLLVSRRGLKQGQGQRKAKANVVLEQSDLIRDFCCTDENNKPCSTALLYRERGETQKTTQKVPSFSTAMDSDSINLDPR
jgi:hypothetical protein